MSASMMENKRSHEQPAAEASESKKKAKTSGDEEEHTFPLTDRRKVVVRKFKGKVLIDIREFYEKDGEELPGKKGIALTPDQWESLREHADKIDEAIEALTD